MSLFVHQVILIGFRVHLIQLERYLVQITPLAAQEFVYAGRAHHIFQHNRSVVHVVQVTNRVLVVQMHLRTSHYNAHYVHNIIRYYNRDRHRSFKAAEGNRNPMVRSFREKDTLLYYSTDEFIDRHYKH